MIDLDKKCYLTKCCVCVYEEPCLANNFDWLPDGSFKLACPKELKIRLAEEHRGEQQKAIILDILKKYESGEIVEDGSMENKEKTYEQGLEEAWEIARKIILPSSYGGFNGKELKRIFAEDYNTTVTLFANLSVHEAKEKIAAYEAEQAKPKLGDVVIIKPVDDECRSFNGIYLGTNIDGHYILENDGVLPTFLLNRDAWIIEKTGKHFDIQSILDELN